MLELNPRRPSPVYDSKMPFSALNAVPEKIGHLLHGSSDPQVVRSSFLDSLFAARLVTIVFSLLLAFYVYRWAKELYGSPAGLLSLFLYAFSPNLIAHSQLITTDLYGSGMITIATYYFWKFINHRNWKNASLSAATLGIAQLAKYTAIYLYPIFILTALLSQLPNLRSIGGEARLRRVGTSLKSLLKYWTFFLLVNLIVINVGFVFHRSFTPLKNYEFQSRLFQKIQTTGFKHWPVPVPYPFLQGLDMVKESDKTGVIHGNVYLLGKLHTRRNNEIKGFAGYYFYALFFKEPIAAQLFFFFALLFYLINRKKFAFYRNEIFLAIPVVFFLVYFNFFMKTHIGIRYLLIVFPFLYIFSGCSLICWKQLGLKIKFGYVVLCLYLVVSVVSYFPHYLSYFNELAWDRTQTYKILADSNLDWGQSEWYLTQYRISHPEVIVNPANVVSGRIVVSVNALVGVLGNPKRYRWLRDNFKPVGHIAYSYLVYEITPESLAGLPKRYRPKSDDNEKP